MLTNLCYWLVCGVANHKYHAQACHCPLIIAFLVTLAAGAFALRSAKQRAESAQCGNHIASIGCGARAWAMDYNGYLPSTLLSMSNELSVPKILVCPGDHGRKAAASWAAFSEADSSYQLMNPGLPESDPNGVFIRCKIHGHIGYADASVFDGVRRRTKL
jgi:hypothetical protein